MPEARLYKTVITVEAVRHCAVTSPLFGQGSDQLRERIRYLHYSLRTEQAYVHWVRAFIRFHGVRHPATLGSSEVEAFLCPGWRTSARFPVSRIVSTGGPCCSSTARCCARICPWLHRRSEDLGRRGACRWCRPWMKLVRILGFLEGEYRLSAPSFCMERACDQCGSATAGQGSDFRSRHDRRARAPPKIGP